MKKMKDKMTSNMKRVSSMLNVFKTNRIKDSIYIPILFLFLLCSKSVHSQIVVEPLQTKAVDFSFKRGFYDASFTLVLASETPGSTIRYTLDGTKPSLTNGQNYTAPITINANAMVRAYSYSSGLVDSKIKTHTFIFPQQVINQKNTMLADYGYDYSTAQTGKVFWTEEMDPEIVNASQYKNQILQSLKDIPTLSIVMPKADLWGSNGIHWGDNLENTSSAFERECSIEMIYPQGYKGDSLNNWQENAGISIQGGGGRWDKGTYDHKQSFTLVFKKKYGAGKLENEMFADAPHGSESVVGKYDKIILRSGHNKGWGGNRADAVNTVYTRDQLGRDLQIQMSGFGSHGTFLHLYLNGKYWGLYNPSERPDNDYLANHLGGKSDDYFYAKGKDSGASSDRVGELGQSKARFFEATTKNYSTMPFDEMKNWVMMDESIASFLVYGYANPGDGPQYYYGNTNNPPGPVVWTPWDVEDSFEGDADRTGPPSVANMIKSRTSNDNGFTAFWTNPDFRMYFNDLAYKHLNNDGALTDTKITASWDKLNSYIYGAMICESARWGDERREPPFDRDDEWEQERVAVRNDFKGKAADFISKLQSAGYYSTVKAPLYYEGNNKLAVSKMKLNANFSLTIKKDGTEGIVYYTIDGTDPRTWDLQGKVSTNALTFSGASTMITISKTTLVKARTKTGEVWSPLHEISFVKDSPCASEITANGPTTFCSGSQVTLSAIDATAYQWLKNGQNIQGQTSKTYVANSNGDYSVSVTIGTTCIQVSNAIKVTINPSQNWYADLDKDGKGDPNSVKTACTQPLDYVADATDLCPTDKNKFEPGLCGCNKTEASCVDCNGEAGGTAFIDNCELCVGGKTNFLACKGTMEAENPCFIDGKMLESTNEGFKGQGYVNTDNKLGASVAWVIKSTQTQSATISFRYANGGANPRNGDVFVNDLLIGQLLMPTTGAWTTWKTTALNLSLKSGANEIKITSVSAEGLGNLDLLNFSEGISNANCPILGLNTSQVNYTIHPNPTRGKVFLGEKQDWILLNAQGQEIEKGNSAEVELSSRASGVYFLKIGVEVVQIIKQ